MVSKTSKLLIINAVRHTEAHNKRVEEKDMWNLRRKEIEDMKREKQLKRKQRDRRRGTQPRSEVGDNFTFGGCLIRENGVNKAARSEPSTSHKWAAELVRYEESLGDERWGHGGYKELYPEEFRNNSPCSSFSVQSDDEQHVSDCKRLKPSYRRDPSGEAYGPDPPPTCSLIDSDSDTTIGKKNHKDSKKKSKKSKKKKKHKKHTKEKT